MARWEEPIAEVLILKAIRQESKEVREHFGGTMRDRRLVNSDERARLDEAEGFISGYDRKFLQDTGREAADHAWKVLSGDATLRVPVQISELMSPSDPDITNYQNSPRTISLITYKASF